MSLLGCSSNYPFFQVFVTDACFLDQTLSLGDLRLEGDTLPSPEVYQVSDFFASNLPEFLNEL